MSASVRNDGGDGAQGTGLEVAGGLRVIAPSSRFGLEAKGRYLALHSESGYKEWGASVSISLAARDDGRGMSLSFAPRMGAAAENTAALWREDAFGGRGYHMHSANDGLAMDARAGYGLHALNLVVTPFGEVFSGRTRAGVDFRPKFMVRGGLNFEVAAERVSYSSNQLDTRLVASLRRLF